MWEVCGTITRASIWGLSANQQKIILDWVKYLLLALPSFATAPDCTQRIDRLPFLPLRHEPDMA